MRRTWWVLLGLTAALAICATALAASPRTGRYAGTTTDTLNGFTAKVSFAVSSTRTKITSFTFQDGGCEASGGGKAGVNYLTRAWNVHHLGSLSVNSHGAFSLSGVKSDYTIDGYTTVTTSSIKGKFTNATTATGTITLTQGTRKTGSSKVVDGCGQPAVRTFTARLR